MSGSEFQGELTDTHGQGSLPYPGINVLDAIAGSAGMYVVSLRTIVQGATLSGQVDDQGLLTSERVNARQAGDWVRVRWDAM